MRDYNINDLLEEEPKRDYNINDLLGEPSSRSQEPLSYNPAALLAALYNRPMEFAKAIPRGVESMIGQTPAALGVLAQTAERVVNPLTPVLDRIIPGYAENRRAGTQQYYNVADEFRNYMQQQASTGMEAMDPNLSPTEQMYVQGAESIPLTAGMALLTMANPVAGSLLYGGMSGAERQQQEVAMGRSLDQSLLPSVAQGTYGALSELYLMNTLGMLPGAKGLIKKVTNPLLKFAGGVIGESVQEMSEQLHSNILDLLERKDYVKAFKTEPNLMNQVIETGLATILPSLAFAGAGTLSNRNKQNKINKIQNTLGQMDELQKVLAETGTDLANATEEEKAVINTDEIVTKTVEKIKELVQVPEGSTFDQIQNIFGGVAHGKGTVPAGKTTVAAKTPDSQVATDQGTGDQAVPVTQPEPVEKVGSTLKLLTKAEKNVLDKVDNAEVLTPKEKEIFEGIKKKEQKNQVLQDKSINAFTSPKILAPNRTAEQKLFAMEPELMGTEDTQIVQAEMSTYIDELPLKDRQSIDRIINNKEATTDDLATYNKVKKDLLTEFQDENYNLDKFDGDISLVPDKVVAPKVTVPKFKTTQEALEFGKTNSKNPEVLRALRIARAQAQYAYDKLPMRNENISEKSRLATESQFYREALEEARAVQPGEQLETLQEQQDIAREHQEMKEGFNSLENNLAKNLSTSKENARELLTSILDMEYQTGTGRVLAYDRLKKIGTNFEGIVERTYNFIAKKENKPLVVQAIFGKDPMNPLKDFRFDMEEGIADPVIVKKTRDILNALLPTPTPQKPVEENGLNGATVEEALAAYEAGTPERTDKEEVIRLSKALEQIHKLTAPVQKETLSEPAPIEKPVQPQGKKEEPVKSDLKKQYKLDDLKDVTGRKVGDLYGFDVQDRATINKMVEDYKDPNSSIHKQPIVVDETGTITEGYKRATAAKLAGVEPLIIMIPKTQTQGLSADEVDALAKKQVQSQGGGVSTMYGGGPSGEQVAGAVKNVVVKDLAPAAKNVAALLKSGIDDGIRVLFPTYKVKAKSQIALRTYYGTSRQAIEKFSHALAEANTLFKKMSHEDRITFIDKFKLGVGQATKELDAVADEIRRIDDAMYQSLEKSGYPVHYLLEHFQLTWKPKTTSDKHNASIVGSKNFIYKQEFTSASAGIKAGYELVSDNPIELLQLSIQKGFKAIAARNMFKQLQDIGQVVIRNKNEPAYKRVEALPEDFIKMSPNILNQLISATEQNKYNLMGHEVFIQKDLSHLVDNMMSRDWFRANTFLKGMLDFKNGLTRLELSLSAFHLMFESIEVITSAQQHGLRRMINLGLTRGNLGETVKGAYQWLTPVNVKAPVEYYKHGRLLKELFDAEDQEIFLKSEKGQDLLKRFPHAVEILHKIFQSGGGFKQYADYKDTSMEVIQKNLNENNPIGAAARAIPALNESLMGMLFDVYIPALKVSMFAHEYELLLAEHKERIEKGVITEDELAMKLWDFVDDRFGEMNFDTLFWNKGMKSALQFTIRSTTWVWGNLRASIGAAPEQLGEIIDAVREGRPPMISPKMAEVFNLFFTVGVMAYISCMFFKKRPPKDWTEYVTWYISPTARVNPATYVKELVSLGTKHPLDYLSGKLSFPASKIMAFLTNKNFMNEKILDWNDSNTITQNLLDNMKSVVENLSPLPFSVKNAILAIQHKESLATTATTFAAFPPIPTWMERTSAEREAVALMRKKLPDEAKSFEVAEKAVQKSNLRKLLRDKSTRAEGIETARKLFRDKKISKSTMRSLIKASSKAPILGYVNNLGLEETIKVWKKATPEEKKLLQGIIKKKYRSYKETHSASQIFRIMAKLRNLEIL